ncbi:hypothetical protein Tco_0199829 [Tanacetum coccineum]
MKLAQQLQDNVEEHQHQLGLSEAALKSCCAAGFLLRAVDMSSGKGGHVHGESINRVNIVNMVNTFPVGMSPGKGGHVHGESINQAKTILGDMSPGKPYDEPTLSLTENTVWAW